MIYLMYLIMSSKVLNFQHPEEEDNFRKDLIYLA